MIDSIKKNITKDKIVEIPLAEFNELVKRYKDCFNKLKQREAIIDYLNKQIRSYNEQFASKESSAN